MNQIRKQRKRRKMMKVSDNIVSMLYIKWILLYPKVIHLLVGALLKFIEYIYRIEFIISIISRKNLERVNSSVHKFRKADHYGNMNL